MLAFFLLRTRAKGSQPSKRLPMTAASHETFLDKLLRVDWVGAALFMAGGILLLLALNWGSTEGWNQAKVIACFVVGGVAIIAFLLWEYFLEREEVAARPASSRLRATDPMIPLELFKSCDICIVMYGTFVSGMIMLVMFYFVAIFFIIVTGLSPTKSGVQLIYFAPGMVRILILSRKIVSDFLSTGWRQLDINAIDQIVQTTQICHLARWCCLKRGPRSDLHGNGPEQAEPR